MCLFISWWRFHLLPGGYTTNPISKATIKLQIEFSPSLASLLSCIVFHLTFWFLSFITPSVPYFFSCFLQEAGGRCPGSKCSPFSDHGGFWIPGLDLRTCWFVLDKRGQRGFSLVLLLLEEQSGYMVSEALIPESFYKFISGCWQSYSWWSNATVLWSACLCVFAVVCSGRTGSILRDQLSAQWVNECLSKRLIHAGPFLYAALK